MRRLLPFALLLLLAACGSPPAPTTESTDAAPPAAADPVVEELGVAEAQARMASGDVTSEALTRAYLARIDAIDRAGPTLRSVIETNPAALDDARALDAERAAGQLRGPLHGIPVLLKDNIDAVGMANSAGSLALAGNRPGDDAFLVTRLREAGAVILGLLGCFSLARGLNSIASKDVLGKTVPKTRRGRLGGYAASASGAIASIAVRYQFDTPAEVRIIASICRRKRAPPTSSRW